MAKGNVQARYETKLVQKKLRDGRTVYATARPRIIPTDVRDFSYTSSGYERLDIIAYNIYGNSMEWWRIAAANGIFNGSIHLTPNQEIKIPK